MNKYIKNKLYKEKCYHRAKREDYKLNFGLFGYFSEILTDEKIREQHEEFLKREEDWIVSKARRMDKGAHRGNHSAPKSFVKIYNRRKRAQDRNHIRHERYDSIEREERHSAEWDYN